MYDGRASIGSTLATWGVVSETGISNPAVRGPEWLDGTHRVDGAARLAGVPPRERAGDRRTVEAFTKLGIPLDLMWGTYDVASPGRTRVRHACLIVPGSGKTAMVFLSSPEESGPLGAVHGQIEELAACIQAGCDAVAQRTSDTIDLVQALPYPEDWWAMEACERAGFTRLGELLYLRMPLSAQPAPAPAVHDGFVTRSVHVGDDGWERDREVLIRTLDRTYEQTLDCPELCGMRDTTDVLESHRLAGEYDPSTWFLAFEAGEPVGCGLFSRAKGRASVELVYLGVAPGARNRGLARHLMWLGIEAARKSGANELTCAVDGRNAPAIALYERCGMREVGRRVALVRSTRAPGAPIAGS